ncbi:calponin homology domain-containing protein, partial [Tribonema minus]
MVGARGGGYGLDAELARKAAANYDYAGEHAAQEWIEAVTRVKFEGTFAAALKDGSVLCKLLNAIRPGTVKKINTSSMPFKQMENISAYLKGCRALGVAEHSLFETVDLYEEKDISLVIKCLFALGSTIQSSVPEFHGPHLGAKMHTANKREFTAEQMAKARLGGAITKQTQGSAAVMERLHVTKGGITMGAEYAGTGDSGSICMTMMGSYGIMERADVVKTGITMGAD